MKSAIIATALAVAASMGSALGVTRRSPLSRGMGAISHRDIDIAYERPSLVDYATPGIRRPDADRWGRRSGNNKPDANRRTGPRRAKVKASRKASVMARKNR